MAKLSAAQCGSRILCGTRIVDLGTHEFAEPDTRVSAMRSRTGNLMDKTLCKFVYTLSVAMVKR